MPRGKIGRPLAGVDDRMNGWLQFRAQLEGDSPERADARVRPRPVKPNPWTGFTERARGQTLSRHVRQYLILLRAINPILPLRHSTSGL